MSQPEFSNTSETPYRQVEFIVEYGGKRTSDEAAEIVDKLLAYGRKIGADHSYSEDYPGG